MKNKIKKISMILCASTIVFGSISTNTIEADAFSLFKTKNKPYKNTQVCAKYVGNNEFDRLATITNNAVKNISKNNKAITKSSLKNVFSSIFKGGKNKGFLRTYLQNNLKSAQEVNNVLKETNKTFKYLDDTFKSF